MALHPVPAFNDNYIWCWQDTNNRWWIVDPGDAVPVISFFQQLEEKPFGILITHHHGDHIGGVAALQQHYSNLEVVAQPMTCSLATIDPLTTKFAQAYPDFKVLEVPAHTLDHIAFVGTLASGETALFCGDSLFSAGCGRLFEGTAEQLLTVMQTYRQTISPETLICCAHEYTVANLLFAAEVEPSNNNIKRRIEWAKTQLESGSATLPSTMAIECAINPFLRTDDPSIKAVALQRAALQNDDEVAVIACLRTWKDEF